MMGLMDKFKNLFTEEVEIEEEVEPIKKEVMQVEIPSPARRSTENVEPTAEARNDVSLEPEPKKDEYKFPFFDDEDFNTIEAEEPKKSSKKKSAYRKETKEVYSPPKEEKRVFKPSPIISPVYGILDQTYQKEDVRKKNERPRFYYNPKEATVDEIRNKAYGTLEDDIETTLFGHSTLLEDEPVVTNDVSDEILDNVEPIEELTLPVYEEEILKADLMDEKPRHGLENADLEITDLLEEELGKKEDDEILEQPNASSEPRKISDAELLSMIDTMYQKGDK